ncbi:hypothetical protein C1645_809206 [Glomus cerebriforme]|uniref:Uncharacterized protein n=1 Tax=Glomus cerebriforme TaxID=658196 RepID=A0A397SAX2_9GLOM|nr:hypothetical protein C1645_809206 [Glomus cerebriforme]
MPDIIPRVPVPKHDLNMKQLYTRIFLAAIMVIMSLVVDENTRCVIMNQLGPLFDGTWKPITPLPPPSSKPLSQFTNFTTDLFNDFNSAEIPAPSEMTQHVILCNRVANVLEKSKAHPDTGKTAAIKLRTLSDLLYKAGDSLREMFVESNSVYRTFDIEVKAMIEKIQAVANFVWHDSKYFKTRISKLEITLGKFARIVEEAKKAVMEAQSWREEVESSLLDFQIESEDDKVDVDKTKEMSITNQNIEVVKDMLSHLTEMANGLQELRGKLKDYEIRMNKVNEKLDTAFQVTREDLENLEAAVKSWKEYHQKFLLKENPRIIIHQSLL